MVVNPACLKDLDCVTTCPAGNIRYGFARPPVLRFWQGFKGIRLPYDFSPAEDAMMTFVFVACVFVFRGLYDAVPFLITLGIGGIASYVAVQSLRLITRRDVRMNNLLLKRAGSLTHNGWAFASLSLLFVLFTAHRGFIRYHEYFGQRDLAAVERSMAAAGNSARPDAPALSTALRHHQLTYQWGLFTSPRLKFALGRLTILRGDAVGCRRRSATCSEPLRCNQCCQRPATTSAAC